MKKINIDEEFALEGTKFCFRKENDKIVLRNMGPAKASKKPSGFQAPTIEEVEAYFKAEQYPADLAVTFFKYYSAADWKDGKGTPVRNWKQKAISVWFKPEKKIKEETVQSPEKKSVYRF